MTWNDISFKQYLDILDLYNDKDMSDADRTVEICKILYEINILTLPLTDYGKYINGLNFLNQKPPKLPLLDEYTVNGTTYVVTNDVANLTVAQYMDCDALIKKSKDIENYPQIMACFMVPKGKKYGEGYLSKAVAEDMEDLPVTAVLALAAFFLNYYRRFIKISLIYLRRKLRKLPKTERKKVMEEMNQMRQIADGLSSLL